MSNATKFIVKVQADITHEKSKVREQCSFNNFGGSFQIESFYILQLHCYVILRNIFLVTTYIIYNILIKIKEIYNLLRVVSDVRIMLYPQNRV